MIIRVMANQSHAAYHKRNLAWPLAYVGNRFVQATLAERYEAAIRQLMNTPLYSLLYAPDYGTLFYRMRPQGANRDQINMAMVQMQRVAAKYIPDVQIIKVDVEVQDEEQKLRIVCTWLIRDANANMHGDLARARQTQVLV